MLILKVYHFIHYLNVLQHGFLGVYTLLECQKNVHFETAIRPYIQCFYHFGTDENSRIPLLLAPSKQYDKELITEWKQIYPIDACSEFRNSLIPILDHKHGNGYAKYVFGIRVLLKSYTQNELIVTLPCKKLDHSASFSATNHEMVFMGLERNKEEYCFTFKNIPEEYLLRCSVWWEQRWITFQISNIATLRLSNLCPNVHTTRIPKYEDRYQSLLMNRRRVFTKNTIRLQYFTLTRIDRHLTNMSFRKYFCEPAVGIFELYANITQHMNCNDTYQYLHTHDGFNLSHIYSQLYVFMPYFNLLGGFELIHKFSYVKISKQYVTPHIEFNQLLRDESHDLSGVLILSVITMLTIRTILCLINRVNYVRSKPRIITEQDCVDSNDQLNFVFRSQKQRTRVLKMTNMCKDSNGAIIREQFVSKQSSFNRFFNIINQLPQSLKVYPVFKTVLDDHFESSLSDESYSSCNKIELIRVGTFSKFPTENKPWYLGLARAGFFYTGKSDIVECFHCHIKHGNWKARDDPFEVHRRISPSCGFLNSVNSLNVPVPRPRENDIVGKSSGASRNSSDNELIQNGFGGETKTFNENIKQNPEQVHCGLNGVHNAKQRSISSDQTKKSICNNSHANLPDSQTHSNGRSATASGQRVAPIKNESPKSVSTNAAHDNSNQLQMGKNSNHVTKPQNGFIPQANANQAKITNSHQNFSETPRTNIQRSTDSVKQTHRNKNLNCQQQPNGALTSKYPEFSSQNVRASTFHGWPATTGQTPRRMAEAGFIYAGYSDYVRCFFCGEGLSEWEREDDPWIEHAKWFPHCHFLRQNKGDTFIYLVRQNIQNQGAQLSSIANATNQTTEKSAETGLQTQYSSTEVQPVHVDTSSAAVQSVQEMGYSRDVIDAAIESLRNEKTPINAHNIMVVILSLPGVDQDRSSDYRSEPIQLSHSNENEISLISHETISSFADTQNDLTSSLTQGSSTSNMSSLTPSTTNSSSNNGTAHASTMPSAGRDIDTSSQFQGLSLSDVQSMRNENRLLKENRLCRICQDNASTVVFVPCGHLVCCEECAYSMQKCPACSRTVEGRIKTWT